MKSHLDYPEEIKNFHGIALKESNRLRAKAWEFIETSPVYADNLTAMLFGRDQINFVALSNKEAYHFAFDFAADCQYFLTAIKVGRPEVLINIADLQLVKRSVTAEALRQKLEDVMPGITWVLTKTIDEQVGETPFQQYFRRQIDSFITNIIWTLSLVR